MSEDSKNGEVGGLTAAEWVIVAGNLATDLAKALQAWRVMPGVDDAALARLHADLATATKNGTFEGLAMERETRVLDVSLGLQAFAFSQAKDALPDDDG